MFKDVFVLKKKSWHMSMMKYIWGFDHRDFTHMCPYFWLSVFNFLAITFVFLYRCIAGLLGFLWRGFCSIFEALDDYIIAQEEEKVQRILEELRSDSSFLDGLATKLVDEGNFDKRDKKVFEALRYDNAYAEYYAKFQEMVAKKNETAVKKKQEKEEKIIIKYVETPAKPKKPRKSNKEIISNIVVKIKPIFKALTYIFISAVCMTILFLLYKGIMLLGTVESKTWGSIGTVLLWVLAVLAGLVIVVLILRAIIAWVSKIEFPMARKFFGSTGNTIAWPFVKIWSGIVWCALGIASFFTLVIQMFKDNCPAIQFED